MVSPVTSEAGGDSTHDSEGSDDPYRDDYDDDWLMNGWTEETAGWQNWNHNRSDAANWRDPDYGWHDDRRHRVSEARALRERVQQLYRDDAAVSANIRWQDSHASVGSWRDNGLWQDHGHFRWPDAPGS